MNKEDLEAKIEALEYLLQKQIRRFDHLYAIVDQLDLTDSQRRRMLKAWWGSEDE